jgi:hypothetical protein
LNPISISADRSGVSSSATRLPSVSYRVDPGAASIRDALSTKYLPDSDTDEECEASPGLRSFMPVPSKPTR